MIDLRALIIIINYFFGYYSQAIESTFAIQKIFLNQKWILSEILTFNPISCLAKCNQDFYCTYVKYYQNKCTMYSEYAKTNLQGSEYVYEKSKTIFPNCSDDEFWSMKQQKCLSCPNGFIKYLVIPYACYKDDDTNRTFFQAKTYCTNLGAHLIRTKTLLERKHFNLFFPLQLILVDSSINSAGETYRWGDGSLVGGFAGGQPNNKQGNATFLSESILILQKGALFDTISSLSLKTLCQID